MVESWLRASCWGWPAVLLAPFAAPWWMTVLVVSCVVLLLGKLVNLILGGAGKASD
ncbi:hypothetical protein [Thiobacillus sp. 65-1402]|uniref:hypothetical protein n=1 Tax=Thiobacillus sp. 65-1402 TaxID=1895861 RepID=UPI0025FF613F|nr:hypothetical protein [Thiobacillus sp. 65-1402]